LGKRDFPNQPAYDILHKILYNQEKLREEFNETREFLEMAIEDKKQIRIENEELRQRIKRLEAIVSPVLGSRGSVS
jgi:regulator of replication initiation timing